MEPSEIPSFSDPAEVARFIEGHDRVGVLVPPEKRESLFASLTELLAKPNRRIILGEPGASATGVLDVLRSLTLPARQKSALEWRDAAIAGLRAEQRSAQERNAAAKAVDAPIDPFDRDVSSWLAAGLRDLLEDPIAGASFLAEGKGIFTRLATGESANFAESDFLRPDGIRFLEAGRAAQSMLTKLSLASTNLYRAAAARLLNRVLDHLEQPELPPLQRIAQALTRRGEELVLLMEGGGDLDWLSDVEPPISTIVALEDASALPPEMTLIRFVDAVVSSTPEPAEEQQIAQEPASPLPTEAVVVPPKENVQVELFIQRGLLHRADVPDDIVELQQRIATAWRRWFIQQLEGFDAEGFLTHEEEVATLARNIAAVTRMWEQGDVSLRLPLTEEDFAEAERAIAEIRRLDAAWRIYLYGPIEDGMAFDAAVAAGGAPLDMLTEGVRWWLREENRDWKKYRIVRIDDDNEAGREACPTT